MTKAKIDSGELQLHAPETMTTAEKGRRAALARGETSTGMYYGLSEAMRFVPGGRNTLIELVHRAARNGDSAARRWWMVWSDLRLIDQRRVELDAVCETAGVPPDEIMAVAISTAMRFGTDIADLTAAIMHPRIVQQTARSAMRIGGEFADVAQKDRQWMLEHGKFISGPKPTQVTVNASAQAAAAAASQPSVPTFLESVGGAQHAHRSVQRQLTSVVEGESVDVRP